MYRKPTYAQNVTWNVCELFLAIINLTIVIAKKNTVPVPSYFISFSRLSSYYILPKYSMPTVKY